MNKITVNDTYQFIQNKYDKKQTRGEISNKSENKRNIIYELNDQYDNDSYLENKYEHLENEDLKSKYFVLKRMDYVIKGHSRDPTGKVFIALECVLNNDYFVLITYLVPF